MLATGPLAEHQKALGSTPNHLRGLAGALKAARLSRGNSTARKYAAQLVTQCEHADRNPTACVVSADRQEVNVKTRLKRSCPQVLHANIHGARQAGRHEREVCPSGPFERQVDHGGGDVLEGPGCAVDLGGPGKLKAVVRGIAGPIPFEMQEVRQPAGQVLESPDVRQAIRRAVQGLLEPLTHVVRSEGRLIGALGDDPWTRLMIGGRPPGYVRGRRGGRSPDGPPQRPWPF